MAKYERCQQSREMDLREQFPETAQADRQRGDREAEWGVGSGKCGEKVQGGEKVEEEG